MHPLLGRVFAELEQTGIVYCLLRDAERLDALAAGGEVDLLVQADQFALLERVLTRLGFVRMADQGYAPHHLFIVYDPATDGWLKLDVVTEVAFGGVGGPWRTNLADNCLARRKRTGPTYAPAPEDELVTLLLHGVLDKGRFAPARLARLQALCRAVADEPHLAGLLATYWGPDADWTAIAAQIDAGGWDALLAMRDVVAAHLARRQPLAARLRPLRSHVLRRWGHLRRLIRPDLPTVALLGPDGAGKSTLAGGISETALFPVGLVYMGLYPKGARRAAGSLPGLGLARTLASQWRRYLLARYRQARGHLVIFDRYPYDALLPVARRQGWARRARRWLLAHACPPPTLVLVLDAPAETLFARKGEHSVETLQRQRESYRQLGMRLPQASILDSALDAGQIRRHANTLIWQAYARQHAGDRG